MLKNFSSFLKHLVQVSLASFYQYRPVVKDPISFLSTEIYKKYNPKIVVTLKKPLAYVYSEYSRDNLPPWSSLRPYLDENDFSTDVNRYLHKAYDGYLSLEAQQALFWFCSIKMFGTTRLMDNDCYFIRFDEYLKSPEKFMSDLCLFLDLQPSPSTSKLLLNNNLGFLDSLDSFLRNYNFSNYTSRSSSRSASTIASFLPNADCVEIVEKFCNPLALQLGWSNLSLSI